MPCAGVDCGQRSTGRALPLAVLLFPLASCIGEPEGAPVFELCDASTAYFDDVDDLNFTPDGWTDSISSELLHVDQRAAYGEILLNDESFDFELNISLDHSDVVVRLHPECFTTVELDSTVHLDAGTLFRAEYQVRPWMGYINDQDFLLVFDESVPREAFKGSLQPEMDPYVTPTISAIGDLGVDAVGWSFFMRWGEGEEQSMAVDLLF